MTYTPPRPIPEISIEEHERRAESFNCVIGKHLEHENLVMTMLACMSFFLTTDEFAAAICAMELKLSKAKAVAS